MATPTHDLIYRMLLPLEKRARDELTFPTEHRRQNSTGRVYGPCLTDVACSSSLPVCRSWGCRYRLARTFARGLCGHTVQGASSDLLGSCCAVCGAATCINLFPGRSSPSHAPPVRARDQAATLTLSCRCNVTRGSSTTVRRRPRRHRTGTRRVARRSVQTANSTIRCAIAAQQLSDRSVRGSGARVRRQRSCTARRLL